jgi:uncharacterized membrane protein
MSKEIVAIFGAKEEAEKAANELEQKGIHKGDVSIAYLTDTEGGENETTSVTGNDNISSGTVTGGTIGGIAGLILGAGTIAVPGLGIIAAAGPVAGLITGALAGGVIGGITDLGISNDDKGGYTEEIRRGRVYFSVPVSDDNGGTVSRVLKDNGALNVEVHNKK